MTKADDIEDSSAPLIEHLAELRNRLIWAVSAFIIAMVACFLVAEPILGFLLTPIEDAMRALGNPNPIMQYTAPQEYFFTLIHISVVAGLALSFPVIAYQLWRFVAPGLYRNEKNAFLPFLIASPVLFILGAVFSHYIVTPLAMTFFLGFADATSVVSALLPAISDAPIADMPVATPLTEAVKKQGIDIVFQGKVNETLDISLKLIIAFGLCFQLPVLLTLMGKAGLVSSAGLAGTRKYAVVMILLTAALVTPPDILSQLILFLAVYPLYEVSIFLIRRIEKKREAELRAQGLWEDPEADEEDHPA
ncbi:MAG: twin-arginine translocase subunit TatC [Pseudotabrizicola sp.]|uniref:twin-arginine translocase subunit TatC n=1 Tax=Pseudotabrizicola sp. TaxID=2939647 RepID=UPI002722348F|nr:twin-arginine translocase subunit TatC [Pseudotabrizicola sp.]MDO8881853.1 twin-arginine translocase subunit TatC [Pseudotabrizicola sp.]MDP2083103.1 twin-arginine translocase subunit TatC [Pseudotabrizicola sp.]MDZ7572521.1 twin-arginine translocase subunit TatC [Pseudotabrizicola sp.]